MAAAISNMPGTTRTKRLLERKNHNCFCKLAQPQQVNRGNDTNDGYPTKCVCCLAVKRPCPTRGRSVLLHKNSPRFSTLSVMHSILILNLVVVPLVVDILGIRTSLALQNASACHPGGPGGRRPFPRKIKPIVYRQHVPNVSEKTIGASGPSEGKITKDSKRYREELVINLNPNIIFKDEEQTNADRMMTGRCRDSLNRLATMVSVHWKGEVGLRVTEAWDEDGAHELDSLHYEGRAVDITTTDKDRSKYGILARLAVEAGFDWVFYESRSHVHCSVKSEKSDAARYGGCFSGDSTALRPDGTHVKMSSLSPGDSVMTLDPNGNIVEDVVLTFMDRQMPTDMGRGSVTRHNFVRIHTGSTTIKLTGNHLIYALPQKTATEYCPNNVTTRCKYLSQAVYARSVTPGDYVIVARPRERDTELSRVVSVTTESSGEGAFAPLTAQGTILVDGVAASCYAVLESHQIAHWVMAPLRYFHVVQNWWRQLEKAPFANATALAPAPRMDDGVHWYSRVWYNIGAALLPKSVFVGI